MSFRHILYDLWVEHPETLERTEPLEEILLEAARRSGMTIIHSHFHQFDPHGVSGVVLIAQSHLTIHTWSEDDYAAVDIFTYGDMRPEAAIGYIRDQLQPVREKITDLSRGGSPALGQG